MIREYSGNLIFRLNEYININGQKPDGSQAFVLDAETQARYPKFIQLVKSLPSFVENDEKVKNAIVNITQLPYNKVRSLLRIGYGPRVSVINLLIQYPSGKVLGHCSCPGFPITGIEIEEAFVKGLEQTESLKVRQATATLLAIVLLHEFVHYGAYVNNIPEAGAEFGLEFEQEAFGVTIDRHNANEFVYRLFKK